MLGWCKAHLHRDAKMQALGLTLRAESGKGEGVYYDGKGGLPWGQELGSLIDQAPPHQALSTAREACQGPFPIHKKNLAIRDTDESQ